jgi:hypothetical protein
VSNTYHLVHRHFHHITAKMQFKAFALLAILAVVEASPL